MTKPASLLAVSLLVLAAAPAVAQRITSVEPAALVTVPATEAGSTREITIRGEGITPVADGFGYAARIRVQARRDGGEWRELPAGGGWSSNLISKNLRSSEWLTTPGTLEVRVVIDGRPTAPAAIAVRAASTAPPVISSVSTTTFAAGATADPSDARWLTYVRGTGFSDPLRVTIGGVAAPVGRMSVDEGYALVYLPRDLRERPGRYPVVATTRAGASAPAYVEVVAAPRVVAVEPGELVVGKVGEGPGVRVVVRFEGSMPASARVGSDELGWSPASPLAVAGDPGAVQVDVPLALVNRAELNAPRQIQIELANAAGRSAGTVTARVEMTVQRIPSAVERPNVGTLRQPPVVRPPPVARPPAPPRP